LVLAASGILAACSPRQVDVRTAPTQATAVSLQVNNTLSQAVNVYVTVSGSDTFLRQVGANSSATIRCRVLRQERRSASRRRRSTVRRPIHVQTSF
jgi:hypothetical protein